MWLPGAEHPQAGSSPHGNFSVSHLNLAAASQTSQKAKETGQTEQLTKYPRSILEAL